MNKMDKKMLKVTYNNTETKEFVEGTTFLEISEAFKNNFKYDIVVAKADNDIVDLSDILTKKCDVEFYDRSSSLGNSIYLASASFMLTLAVKSVLGEDVNVITKNSLNWGICFYTDETITKSIVNKIEEEMINISASDYRFVKMSVSRIDAMKYFKKRKQMDKVKLLKYISNTYVNLYRVNDIYDYFYTKMAYSTKAINEFKVTYIDDHHFVLLVPDFYNPEKTLDYKHYKKVYDEFINVDNFGKSIGISNASDLNDWVSNARTRELITLAETYYDNQLAKTAADICKVPGKYKVIFLAGPSSSGKTTTANKLKNYIKIHGINAYNISTDDYFVSKDHIPKDLYNENEYDYDSIKALDVELFNSHLKSLLEGKKVDIPVYNFIKQKREYHNNFLKLEEDDVVIVEGIHALNEAMCASIDQDKVYKIFLSPLTHLNIDDHNYIHTTDLRKLRRITRDSRTRGHNAADTLSMWRKVFLNEQTAIYPHQDEVNMVINSSLLYEIGVLKTYVEPLLFNIHEESPVYPEALRLINFLRNFLPIPSDDIPNDSVIREFIGGSCFKE